MATKTGYSAGRVFLQVVPSYRNFLDTLRRDAAGPLGKAIADTFEKELKKSGASSGENFGKTVRKNIEKGLEVDRLTADVRKKLDKAFSDLGDGPDASSWRKSLASLRKDIDETGRVEDKHIRQLEALSTAMSKAGHDTADLAQKHRLLSAATAVDSQAAKAHADSLERTTDAARRTGSAEEDRSRAHRDADNSANSASRSGRGLSGVLRSLRGDSQDGANAFRFFNFTVLASAAVGAGLIPVLASLAGGLALLGPILGGLAGGLGVAALGFSGISDAVGALGAQQDATSGSSRAYANSLRSAARSVADARRGLKDAYRQSADGIHSALERQEDAERSLGDAQKDAREAQQGLTAARKEAREEQANLANQIAQNQLDERQGVIDLFNAYNQYGAVMADGGSTNLEREQADIALKQAQLNLKRIREEQKELADGKKKADKEGVDGSDGVRRAQDRLTEALDRQRDAERRLRRAADDTVRARQDGARAIADAQRTLTRAHEDYASAAQGSAAATDKVTQAMDKLSPEGRRFARFIFSLKSGFQEVRGLAQKGLLPGVESGLQRLFDTYGPGFKKFVSEIALEMGNLSDEAGSRLSRGGFREFFAQLGEDSKFYTRDAGQGLLDLLEGVSNIFVIASPYARAFSKYIADTMRSFNGWTDSQDGRDRIQDFFGYVDRIAPRVKDFFVSVGSAFGAIAVALAPIGESILTHLTDMFNGIASLSEGQLRQLGVAFLSIVVALQASAGITAMASLIGALAAAPFLVIVAGAVALGAAFFFLGRSSEKNEKLFRSLYKAAEPLLEFFKDVYKEVKDHLVKLWEDRLLPMFKALGAQIRDELMPAFERFLPVLKPFASWLIDVFFKSLDITFEAIGEIIGGLITILTGILDFVTGIFTGDWKLAWSGIRKIFSGTFRAIGGIVTGFFKSAKLVFSTGMSALKRLAKIPLDAVGDLFGAMKDKALGALRTLRDESEKIMKKVGNFLKDPLVGFLDFVLNDGLIDAVRTIQGWVGVKEKNKLGHAGGFGGKYAEGGVLPGYTPGRDVHRFFSPTGGRLDLSGGEGILVPQATRALGGKAGIERINSRARQGLAFAKGGIFWPTVTKTLSGDYPGHTGVDISGVGINGKPVFAAHAGKVSAVNRWNYSYGNHIRVRGTDGIETIYGHLSRIATALGAVVKGGQQIGNVGSTGNSSGPHLHFEVRPGATRAAALAYLNNGRIPKGGKGIVDKLAGLSDTALGAIKNPEKFLRNSISKGFDKLPGIGGSGIGTMLKGIPEKLLGGIVEKLKHSAMRGLDIGKEFFKYTPIGIGAGIGKRALGAVDKGLGALGIGGAGIKLYDNGGLLPPGLSTVFNATGKPEPVFSPDQWDKLSRGGGVGGDIYQLHAEGADPRQVVGELMSQLNRQKRMARRSGSLSRRGV